MTVVWTDNSDDETGFEVYRTSPSALSLQQADEPLATVPADTDSFVDFDIELDTAYDYQVVAVGAEGASEGAAAQGSATVKPGVDLLVGTVDRVYDDDTTGTVFIVYLVFDEAELQDPNVDIDVTIAGPPGWNGGVAASGPVPVQGSARQFGFARIAMHSVDSVAGTYTLTVMVDGMSYEATAELSDTAYRVGRPSDIDVSVAADESAVTGTWTSPPEAVTTYATVHAWNWGGVLRGAAVDGAEMTFSELGLDDGPYLFDIMNVNVDLLGYPVKVEQFGQSGMYSPFGIGDPQSALCASPEELVDVPDPALQEAVLASLYRQSGDIKCIDLILLEGVWAENAGIESLEGLQYADNLRTVELGENNLVSSIEPLRDLELLEDLSLWGSPLADASPLAGKTTLQGIDFGGTNLTDLSFLEGLVNLESLHLWNLHGIDVSPVHDLTQLRWLSLTSTGLTDADTAFLEDLTALEALWLEWNELTSLAHLVANPGLGDGDEVWVHHNFLDLADPGVMADVQALLDRGVELHYEDQDEVPQ